MTRRYTQPQVGPAKIDPAFGVAHAWAANVAGSGRLRDSAGNADGVFGVGTGGTTGNYWVLGPNGWEILFDSTYTGGVITSTRLAVGNASGSAAPSGTRWSFECDVLLGSLGTLQAVFGGTDSGIEIRVDASGTITLLKQAIVVMATTSTTLSAGIRYKLAVTYDGANVAIYINGKLNATAVNAQSFTHGQYFLGWANVTVAEYLVNGSRMGRVVITNHVLSAAEVFDRYQNPWRIFAPVSRGLWMPAAGGAIFGVTANTAPTAGAMSFGPSSRVAVLTNLAPAVGAMAFLSGDAPNISPGVFNVHVSRKITFVCTIAGSVKFTIEVANRG